MPVPIADQITIREARVHDAQAIAQVHVDTWRSTYHGILPDQYLASLSYEDRRRFWTRVLSQIEFEQFIYVAQSSSGQIVGFATGGPERSNDRVFKGEVYAIYILPPFQGQGVGRTLLATLVERLIHVGVHSLLIWVLADNTARHFYEALGGQVVRTKQIILGGVTLEEVAYGWTEASRILEGKHDDH